MVWGTLEGDRNDAGSGNWWSCDLDGLTLGSHHANANHREAGSTWVPGEGGCGRAGKGTNLYQLGDDGRPQPEGMDYRKIAAFGEFGLDWGTNSPLCNSIFLSEEEAAGVDVGDIFRIFDAGPGPDQTCEQFSFSKQFNLKVIKKEDRPGGWLRWESNSSRDTDVAGDIGPPGSIITFDKWVPSRKWSSRFNGSPGNEQ